MSKRVWIMAVTVVFAIVAAGAAFYSYRISRTVRAKMESRIAVVLDDEHVLLERQIRDIVRDEYAAYQSELNNMLIVIGFGVALLGVFVPMMLHRERVKELDEAIAESKRLREKIEESEEQQEELKKRTEELIKLDVSQSLISQLNASIIQVMEMSLIQPRIDLYQHLKESTTDLDKIAEYDAHIQRFEDDHRRIEESLAQAMIELQNQINSIKEHSS